MNFQTRTNALQDWLLSVKLNLNGEKEWDAYTLIWRACYTVVLAYLIRGICLALYRTLPTDNELMTNELIVTLHPLANVPGPKLAAMGWWYEFYYDVVLGGQYFKRIKELHALYGPAVRVNPEEVHFNDVDFIDSIFPQTGRKTDKPVMVGQRTGTPNSIVATLNHQKHRIRRNSINGFFSNASIRRVEPTIREKLEKMLARWTSRAGKEGKILHMHTIFKAYASDIITTYAFGDCFHFLDEDDWGEAYFTSTEIYFKLNHAFAHIPYLSRVVNSIPPSAFKLFAPDLAEMAEKQSWWINRVRQIRSSPNPDDIKNTIFEGILGSSLPPEEKTDARMAHDAQLIGLAGEGTTAYTLTATLFELLKHPSWYAKVRAEIQAAVPDKSRIPSFAEVENLVYFNAVIQETLRIHPGVVSRMHRISPDEPIVYPQKPGSKGFVLPPGTWTSMTTLTMHSDHAAFDNPLEWHPERWIENPKSNLRAFIGFSRGSRNCVGYVPLAGAQHGPDVKVKATNEIYVRYNRQNMARREMGMVLATILNRFDIYKGQDGPTLELYDTVRERDIDCNSEMIIPMPAKGSHSLRVRVRS